MWKIVLNNLYKSLPGKEGRLTFALYITIERRQFYNNLNYPNLLDHYFYIQKCNMIQVFDIL